MSLSRRSNNNNNNNNNNKAFPFLFWRGLRRRSSRGSRKGRKSVISGGDKGGRFTTVAAGIKRLVFWWFAPLWRIVNDIFFLFLFIFFIYIYIYIFFLINNRVLVIYFVPFCVFMTFPIILKDLSGIF